MNHKIIILVSFLLLFFLLKVSNSSAAEPVLMNNNSLGVAENGNNHLSAIHLLVEDADTLDPSLTYTIINPPEYGQIVLSSDLVTPVTSFTQEDILEGRISYKHNDGAGSFQVEPIMNLSTLIGNNGFTFFGDDPNELSGYYNNAHKLSDLNGDNISDIIIGAINSPALNQILQVRLEKTGQSYVIYGDESVASEIRPADLDGDRGFTVNGADGADSTGSASNDIGDVNGDGLIDIFIGGWNAGSGDEGAAYILFGKQNGFDAHEYLSDLEEDTQIDSGIGVILRGDDNDYAGLFLSTAGDFNGDGINDLAIVGTGNDTNGINTGVVYLIWGRDQSNPFPELIDLGLLDAQDGIVIRGYKESLSQMYLSITSVDSIGDINNDNYDDLIIGASTADSISHGDAPGQVYVIFGGEGSSLPTTPITVCENSVCADLAILELSDIETGNGIHGFVINGSLNTSRIGDYLSRVNDFDLDGYDDFIFSSKEGAVLIYGAQHYPAVIELSTFPSNAGILFNDSTRSSNLYAASASAAGDVNNDGYSDILVGYILDDSYLSLTPFNATGVVFLVYGRSKSSMSTTFDLSTLTNPANGGIIYNGIYANSWTGSSVASAGDFNNDGYDDVIISAPLSSPGGATSAGETYVVYGNKQHLIITDSVDFTLTDDSGNSINSSFNIEIYPVNSEPEGEPEINAETTPEPGDLITVSTSGITDADGLSTLFRYQWYSAGQVIIDANDSSYTVSADDLGNQISVDVSYTDDEGFIETFTVNAGVVSDITPPTITLLNTPDNLSSDQQDIVILGYLNENGSLEGGVGNTVVSNLQVFDSLAASIELGVSTTANTRNGMFIKLAEDGSGHITNGSSINKEHHFYFPVSLEPGTNLIRLTATDDYSNSNTKYLPITYQHSTMVSMIR